MKKTLFLCSILITIYSCTSSKDVSSADTKKKPETSVKTVAPDRDSRGNYLK